MSNTLIDNQKVNGGVVSTAGSNTNVWYERETEDTFSLNGSFANLQTIFDWVMIRSFDESLFKAGIVKFCGNKKSLVVNFDSPFPSTDYLVFFTTNNNVNTFWVEKKSFRFVMNGSYELGSEVSWFAIHKELAILTGVNNPGTMFSGSRILVQDSVPLVSGKDTLDITDDDDSNLTGWYNNEYIIQPSTTEDNNLQPMDLSDYSVILSSNININTFWIEKAADRVKIGTSFPAACTIDYFIIKSGVNWWNEI